MEFQCVCFIVKSCSFQESLEEFPSPVRKPVMLGIPINDFVQGFELIVFLEILAGMAVKRKDFISLTDLPSFRLF